MVDARVTTVDIHTHVIPPVLLDALEDEPQLLESRRPEENGVRVVRHEGEPHWDRNGRLAVIERELYDVDLKLAEMDRMGIDISAISIAPPAYFYDVRGEAGIRLAQITNDGIAEMVGHAPSRFVGVGTLPMQNPDAAIYELRRVVDEYGFRAVSMGSSVEGRTLDHPIFRPVLEAIAAEGAFLVIHPYQCPSLPALAGYDLFNAVGFPLDEVIMAARLMFTGTLDAIPDLRLVVVHGGGYIPYQIGRLQRVYEKRAVARADAATDPRTLLHRHFYFDSLTHDPAALRMLVDLVGPDRVLIGSDHPFDMGYEDPIARLDEAGLSPEQRAMICSGTARSLLGELSDAVG